MSEPNEPGQPRPDPDPHPLQVPRDRTLLSVLAAAPVGIGLVRGRILGWCNQRLEEILGYAADELFGRPARVLYPDDAEYERVGREKHPQVLAGGVGSIETRMVRKDGEVVDVLLSSAALEPGSLDAGLIYTVLDLSEARRAEAVLRERERAAATLFANLPGMAYRCRNDENWSMEFLSEGCRELTGLPPAAFLENSQLAWADIIHPGDRRRVWDEIQAALGRDAPYELEYRILGQERGERWVWERGRAVRDAEGALVALEGFITDVTDRKHLEQRAVQSQRLEAIGQLAGGVAHDFNNLLQVINGYAAMIEQDLRTGEADPRHVHEIRRAGDRAEQLVRQLLAFSRRQILQRSVIDLNELTANLVGMLARMIGEDIALAFRPAAGIGTIRGDAAQLEQVLVNLCINARDAMPRGGRLEIATAEVELGEADAEDLSGIRPGPHVMLTVADDGEGMSPDVAAQIFEPFYTTKEVGKGTGLGLASVYGVVQQHGGAITVTSAPGEGSRFEIYLPVAGPAD